METWSTKIGFLLAAIGSAVGIGNIWRFSAVVGENGGGAYLIPYVLAVFAFGVPLMVMELAVGRRLRTNMVGAFRRAGQRFEVIGWLVATAVFTILSYYLVITGWTLAFVGTSLAGADVGFEEYTSSLAPIATFIVSAVAAGVIVSLGVRRGIERMATILMPLSLLILLILLVRAVTLPGFGEGVRFLFTPDFSVLSDPRLLSAAVGQAFFSLSVGFGILLTYGSYLSKKDDLVQSATIITLADLGVALIAGLIIFPVVFSFGLEPSAGAELAFTTLPAAFEQMPAGNLLGAAFFLLLFMAALTSAVSMLEVNVAALTERTRLTRRQASAILTVFLLGLGLPSALSYSAVDLHVLGWRVLDALDETLGTMGLPIAAFLLAVVFTRFLPRRLLAEELGLHDGGRRWRHAIIFAVRYPIPIVLFGITASRLILTINPPAWHFLPGVESMGPLEQVVVTVILTTMLLAATLLVVRTLRARAKP